MATPDDVLEFWFADAPESPEATKARNEFWFDSDSEID